MSEFYLRDKIYGWDKREQVKFCLFCCYKVKHLMDEESLETVKLVEKWLEDETSVSSKELRTAANWIADADTVAYYMLKTAYYVYHADTLYWADNTALFTSSVLTSSKEALYLDYMRDKLSDIMES